MNMPPAIAPDVVKYTSRWTFNHGTEVWAASEADAISLLNSVNLSDWFATEMDPGLWEVQFGRGNDVSIVTKAETGLAAAKCAQWFAQLDAHEKSISLLYCPAVEGMDLTLGH
jgi:hypothetical protein